MKMKSKMIKKIFLFSILIFTLLSLQPTIAAKTDETQLPVLIDTFIDEYDPLGNYNLFPGPLIIVSPPGESRSLLLFDVGGLVGTTISSAILNCYVVSSPTGCTASINQIMTMWDPDFVTWDVQPMTLPPFPDQLIIGPGSDYWATVDITPLVMDWALGSENFGLMINSLLAIAELSSIEFMPIFAAYISVTYTIPEINTLFITPIMITLISIIGFKVQKKQKT